MINPRFKADTYKDRPKSYIVAKLMIESGTDKDKVSEKLCMSRKVFNSKLHRGAFSFEDIQDVAQVCGYVIEFRKADTCLDKESFLKNVII